MVNSNPFAPAQVNIAGGVQNLMQQYQRQRVLAKAQELDTARKTALQGLLSGGDPKEAITKLMGIGDIQGAGALATAVKSMQGPSLTPDALLRHQDAQTAQQSIAFARAAAAVPLSTKEYWNAYPAKAPQWYREGVSIGGGDQGMPPPTPGAVAPTEQPGQPAQPTPVAEAPQAPSQWQPNVEQYKLIQSGKMLRPEDAQKHVNLVIDNLDNTKNAAMSLLQNPNFDKAFGGMTNVLTRSPSPGAGAGNLLPGWMTAGTGIADVQAAIKSLKDQISLAIIANMKEASGKAGSTGLGRVMQVEYSGWQNALGSLEHAQSPEAARKSLINIVNFIDRSKEHITGGLAADYGGAAAPTPTAQPTQDNIPPPGQSLGLPGMQTINTPPPPGTGPAASPQGMSDQQTIGLARQLRQQGLNKQQIIDWFKARGVTIEP